MDRLVPGLSYEIFEQEIEFSGTRIALLALADALAAVELSELFTLQPCSVLLIADNGPVAVSSGGKTVTIRGGRNELLLLSENIRLIADRTAPTHVHIDTSIGLTWLDPDSIDLIISLRA